VKKDAPTSPKIEVTRAVFFTKTTFLIAKQAMNVYIIAHNFLSITPIAVCVYQCTRFV
jgi:hypothetical protein